MKAELEEELRPKPNWGLALRIGMWAVVAATAMWVIAIRLTPPDQRAEDQAARNKIMDYWKEQREKIDALNALAAEKAAREQIRPGGALPPNELRSPTVPFERYLKEPSPTYIQLFYQPKGERTEVVVALSAQASTPDCAFAHAAIFWNPRIFGTKGEFYPPDSKAEEIIRTAVYRIENDKGEP